MAFGSFLGGLADGVRSGEGIKQRRENRETQRGILDALRSDGRDTLNGERGTDFVPQNGGTGGGRSVLPAAQGRGSGRGDYASEFDASLARTESGGRYDVVNAEGYTGKYQFGQARLDDYNRATGSKIDTTSFRDDPALQERVQDWHVRDIDSYIDDNGLSDYIGRDVGGVTMTRDGLRAMAHLGGKGGMRKFVTSGGQYNPADSNGTALSDYAATHASALPTTERGVVGRGESLVTRYYR